MIDAYGYFIEALKTQIRKLIQPSPQRLLAYDMNLANCRRESFERINEILRVGKENLALISPRVTPFSSTEISNHCAMIAAYQVIDVPNEEIYAYLVRKISACGLTDEISADLARDDQRFIHEPSAVAQH